jgi:hypothetical protein
VTSRSNSFNLLDSWVQEFLSQFHIVHRDLACRNIMISAKHDFQVWLAVCLACCLSFTFCCFDSPRLLLSN